MKKIYTFFKSQMLLAFFLSFAFMSSTAVVAQPICGPIVENFDNTSGSTAGFTGDFTHAQSGTDGFLVKTNVLGSAIYTITTPTYQLAASANSIGFGFELDGTERVARVEAAIIYFSTLTNQMTTVFLGQFTPTYNAGSPAVADVCRAVALSDLPGFPQGGKYRLRFEFTTSTGSGQFSQTITFDDFRTNGTMAQSPLPVTFVGFEAKKLNSNTVQLTWRVAGEENVSHYEVERSEDGRTFRKVGTISRTGKDTYTYNDANVSSEAYYRVRNVDNDGKYKYSTIARLVNGRSEILIKAFPQPVRSQLTVQHPSISGKALITVSTADGRVVKTVAPATGSMQTYVDMGSLQAGMYMIRFDNGEGDTQTMKIIKQ